MSEKLLPCPFCGGELEITKHFKEDIYGGLHRCKIVGAISFDWTNKESIIKDWNTRQSPKGLTEDEIYKTIIKTYNETGHGVMGVCLKKTLAKAISQAYNNKMEGK